MSMDYVLRDGRVAVLVSPGFGAGWWTWNSEFDACLYHPEIVALVEALDARDADRQEREDVITPVAKRLFGDNFYAGGADDLKIEWVPANEQRWNRDGD